MRVFRRHWQLSAIAVFSLSIAMALGVLGLSVSNTMLVLPPAAPQPERLLTIYGHTAENDVAQISYPDYLYYRRNTHVFSDIAAWQDSISLTIGTDFGGQVVRVMSRPVSDNYFRVLGIRPYLGRFFEPGDDRRTSHIVVMTYLCWKRLGSDPHIVGRKLGGSTIIGVTPESFTGSFYGVNGDLLTPLAQGYDPAWFDKRDVRQLFLLARLRPEASRTQAQAEVLGLAAQLAAAYPKQDRGRTALVRRATLLPPNATANAALISGILMGLVLLVLLIAGANVANLLLAIAVGRRHEAAIKLALGAARARLIRDFLKESSGLCIASGALGYAMAAAVIARFRDVSVEFPMYGTYTFGLNLKLDLPVVAFTVALMLLAILATGLPPALYASNPAIAQILGGEIVVGGTRRTARRNILAVTQVAVCTLVLVGLGLCQRNLYNLRHADLGFSARNLVSIQIFPRSENYTEAQAREIYAKLLKSTAALPGVESAALARDLPLMGGGEIPVQLPGSGKKNLIHHTTADSEFFTTFGIPLHKGRLFNSSDRAGSPDVIVINRKMAETLWPKQDALGKAVLAGDPPAQAMVVGVVADSKYEDIDEPRREFFYYALSQHYSEGINLVARTKSSPAAWSEPLAKVVRDAGMHTPVQPATLQSWMNLSLFVERLSSAVVAALSALGLLLATIGLGGAIAYSVSQRRKELGIRVALGARSGQLLGMILRQVTRIAGVGIAVGLGLGIVTTVLLQSQFYGIGAVEWTVLLPVAAAMLALSLAVAWISARPWIDADPMEAVRHQ
jgi:predicted permease